MKKKPTTRQDRKNDYDKRRINPQGGRYCRDAQGWWVPPPGSKLRRLYDMMKVGTPGKKMAEELGWKLSTVWGQTNRIRKPTRLADHVRILVE